MKWIFLVIGSITLLVFFRTPDQKIKAKVLFINQVRGSECCQKGSYEFTKQQLEQFKKYNLSATFIIRYDALKTHKFITLFKSYASGKIENGIFFEITPSLARDAGIVYKGSEDRWYRAQYAYLVGYSQEERKKLIDTAMAQFKEQFGIYPKTTGGWMIDTFSAEYLSRKYGVKVHEITREQWGTDGYALYGGSILSAYVPSKNWLFVPAQSDLSAFPLRIIRQTLSDPVRNYGDLTSGYTSQPNDYSRTKNFNYFKHLLRQVESYSLPLAVLGLENSLDKQYQDIYEKQIEYVSKVVGKENVILPAEIGNIDKQNFVFGTDQNDTSYSAYWIETAGYRVRLVKKNNSIQLTDLRIFDESVSDPYYLVPSGEKTAYWEIPFVFDSSKKGVHKKISSITAKIGELFRFFGNEDWIRERTNPVVNEQFLQEINGIVFPQLKKGTNLSIGEKEEIITLRYTKEDEKDIVFSFYSDRFFVKGLQKKEYVIKGPIAKSTELKQEQKNGGVFFFPLLNQGEMEEETHIPDNEVNTQAQQSEVSIIYNAPLSLIGRNPARLVVISNDSGGNPTRIKDMKIVHTKGNFDVVKIHETEGHLGEFDGMYYIDIEQKSAGTYTPVLTYGLKQKVLNDLTFVLDCKKNMKACFLNPQKLVEYVQVKFGDIINRR